MQTLTCKWANPGRSDRTNPCWNEGTNPSGTQAQMGVSRGWGGGTILVQCNCGDDVKKRHLTIKHCKAADNEIYVVHIACLQTIHLLSKAEVFSNSLLPNENHP